MCAYCREMFPKRLLTKDYIPPQGIYGKKWRKGRKLRHLKLSVAWKIISENQLTIGETVFALNPKTGILTAKSTADPEYDTYEIKLPRVLN
jgi:hypothetical protein